MTLFTVWVGDVLVFHIVPHRQQYLRIRPIQGGVGQPVRQRLLKTGTKIGLCDSRYILTERLFVRRGNTNNRHTKPKYNTYIQYIYTEYMEYILGYTETDIYIYLMLYKCIWQ